MKNILRISSLIMIFALAMPAAARDIKTRDFSGWLEDYDSLVYVEERNAFIFSNTALRGSYEKVLLEPVALYSKTGKADSEQAAKAVAYLSEGLEKMLEEKGIRGSEPGPGVVRLKIAITGVEKTKEELKAHNLIPVSAVFRGAQAATGNVPTYIATMFEGEAIDSVSGERVMAIVTKGIEETEKRSGDILTFEDLKPTLDKWLAQYSRTMEDFLARKAGS